MVAAVQSEDPVRFDGGRPLPTRKTEAVGPRACAWRFPRRVRHGPTADVEGAVDRQQAQLVGRRPAAVAGLAAAARLSLLDRPLDRDHDVAKVSSATGREREVEVGAGSAARGAGMRREGAWRQQGERQHIGGARRAEVGRIQLGEFGVVAQDQPDRRRRRGASLGQRRGECTGQHGPRDRDDDAVPHRQIDPPRPAVERASHQAAPVPPVTPVTTRSRFRRSRRSRHRRPLDATPAPQPCSVGTRSACGTSPGVDRRTPRGSARDRAV